MGHRSLRLVILTIFSIVMGYFAFRTWSPLQSSEYIIGGEVRPLMLSKTDSVARKSLYLRRTWYMPQAPEHAWLQVLGHDVIEVFVNGRAIGNAEVAHSGVAAALLIDITPHLGKGRNSIGISATQRVLDHRPAVAIEGGYTLTDGQERSLADPDTWRANDHFERGNDLWFTTDFRDEHWAIAKLSPPHSMWGHVDVPPRGITTKPTASWISPPSTQGGIAALRHEFALPSRPATSWLRVTATSPYRLAVNGTVLADDHDKLAAPPPYRPRQCLYDISRFVHAGQNVVAFMLSTDGRTPHIQADLEVTDKSGNVSRHDTGEGWIASAGPSAGWRRPLVAEPEWWSPCHVETGSMVPKQRQLEREVVTLSRSDFLVIKAFAIVLLFMAAAGFVAHFGCSCVNGMLQCTRNGATARVPKSLAYLALVPSTALAAVGILSTYDPAISQQDIYSEVWLFSAWLLVATQWLAIVSTWIVAGGRAETDISKPSRFWEPRRATTVFLFVLCVLAFWLRVRDITTEPIHHDEVGAYGFTMGIFETGFPSRRSHPDSPIGYCATSELVYYPNALVALFIDDPLLILRIPAVCWSIGTLLLLFYVGKRLFSLPVGLVAATFYAVSPYLVGMANFGRYFSQLQFFALLTIYLFYKTIQGRGPIDRRYLWLTASSFIVMFLTWEGSAFLATGLVAAAMLHRRGSLRAIFCNPSIYAAIVAVAVVYLLQNTHRTFQQTQRLWYGRGISGLSLLPMWRYPNFQLTYFFQQASWVRDSLLPIFGWVCAVLLSIRHRFEAPLRVLLVILAVNCGVMAAFLPLHASRYSYHLVPLMILAATVTLVAATEALLKLARGVHVPRWCRRYSYFAAATLVASVFACANGRFVRTAELKGFQTLAYQADMFKFPHWDSALTFLRENMQEGDVVIALYPHLVDFTIQTAEDQRFGSEWSSDYWLQSIMILQATLDDVRATPLDRRVGTVMMPDKDFVEYVFNTHRGRIWYCTIPRVHNVSNYGAVSEYMRKNMDIVFEDHRSVVMLRDNNHRPAFVQAAEEESSDAARTWTLE